MFVSRRFSLIDVVNISFWSIIFFFFIFTINESEDIISMFLYLFVSLFIIFISVFIRSLKINNHIIKLILLFYPALFLIVIFDSLHLVIPYYAEKIYDTELANIDFSFFGFNPTVGIESMINPFMTELMYYLYLFYFPLPLIILGYLFYKKKFSELDKSIFFLMLVYYGSYLLYFIVPALGPRFYEPISSKQTKSLEGLYFTDIIRDTINFLEHNKFDAFPSLHAAITLAAVIIIGQYRKKWLLFFIPVTYGIFVSLIYCRYHYVIDVVIGVIWTLICFWLTEKYYFRIKQKNFSNFY